METSWVTIGQGTVNGQGGVSAADSTLLISQYNTIYSWRIILNDTESETIAVYSFTTMNDTNYAPFIRSPSPADNSEDFGINQPLEATIKDINGDDFDWSVELRRSGQAWQQIDSGEAAGEETISIPTDLDYSTDYSWRVNATDGHNAKNTLSFDFRTRPENFEPEITNPSPADQATDVPLTPTLSAEIFDADDNPFTWQIDISDNGGRNWEPVSSSDGEVTGRVIASGIAGIADQNQRAYTWRVIATDNVSGESSVEYTFTTKRPSYAPTIGNVTPTNGQDLVSIFNGQNQGIPEGTALTAYVEDLDNDNITVTFSWFNEDLGDSGEWVVLDTQASTSKTFKTSMAWNRTFMEPMTNYRWRVTAVDSTGLSDQEEFIFTTGGLLQQKFRLNLGNTGGDQIMPVMGDIDNDGTQELVMNIGGRVISVDGKTGQTEINVASGTNAAVELVDLNNDGTPEILFAMTGPRLRALDGRTGNTLWTTSLGGSSYSMFPIIAYDIDGDGYPTIYFAGEDSIPERYSGNMADYTGTLSMIDHTGKVLKTTWIYHPCWGGMSIGDVNNDGRFELYISDRRARGYLNGSASMGPHAYDAETLELLWERNTIQHSSPIPIIANVIPGGNLEVVLTPITNAGPIVVDGITGNTVRNEYGTLMDFSSQQLPTHGVGTVYDVDGDGHKDIILGSSYPSNLPPEFAIVDLIDGSEKRISLETQVAWAPKLGNVDDEDDMEILVALGPQGWTGTYALLVYKYVSGNYKVIERVEPKNAGQLMPARVYDTDSDGYNEVVVVGFNGVLVVYDTYYNSPTNDSTTHRAPRTWLQMYSEYRQGVAEYVPPPGAPQPIIKETNIANGTINVQPNPTLSVHVIDFHYDKMDINIAISTSASGPWETVASFTDAGNGWYDFIPNSTDDRLGELNETYYWRVSARDPEADDILTTQAYSFTTTPCDQEGYVLLSYYEDNDGDGYGNPSRRFQSCMEQDSEAPEGYVFNNTDCNDGNISINPLALEICDGVDNNCAGGVDEGIDSDGFRVCNDNCPFLYNPDQKDENNNSIGDACECGNGIIDPNEECDGSDLGGKSCSTYRFNAGTLKCTAGCLIDASDCYNKRKKSSSGGGGGGGGSSSVSSNPDEDWNCGEWSLCLNGEQTQVCTHKTMDAQKTNVKSCKTTIDDLLAASQTEDEFMDLLAKATNNVSIINKTVPKGSAVNQTSENNASANSSEVPEITGAVVGSGDGSRKPVWGLALMILGIILAIALAGYNLNKKGIKPIGKKPAYKILEDE